MLYEPFILVLRLVLSGSHRRPTNFSTNSPSAYWVHQRHTATDFLPPSIKPDSNIGCPQPFDRLDRSGTVSLSSANTTAAPSCKARFHV